jgi:2-dehydro-3-deoxyphosphogalactonate aldolase
MADYAAAGASGFGIGSSLFKAGKSVEEIAADARAFADAWRRIAP